MDKPDYWLIVGGSVESWNWWLFLGVLKIASTYIYIFERFNRRLKEVHS